MAKSNLSSMYPSFWLPQAKQMATLKSHYVIMGIVLFFLNLLSEEVLNFPIAEFAIVAGIAYFIYQQQAVLNVQMAKVAFALTFLLGCWVGAMDYYHDEKIVNGLRAFSRSFAYYTLIVGYILLPRKEPIFQLVIGVFVGHALFFIGKTYYMFAFNQSTMYKLKYLLPAPAMFVLTNFYFKEYFSKSIQRISLAFMLTFVFMNPYISARGGFLSLFVGILCYMGVKHFNMPAKPMIIMCVFLPLAFFFPALYFHNGHNIWDFYNFLHDIDYRTNSNIERLFNLHASISILKEHPLTGVSFWGLSERVGAYILEAVPGGNPYQSPHNYYLEFAVPYGIPSMLFVMNILYLIYTLLLKNCKLNGKHPAVAIFIISVVSWAMLTNTGSGYSRFITFYLLITGFYSLNKEALYNLQNKEPSS